MGGGGKFDLDRCELMSGNVLEPKSASLVEMAKGWEGCEGTNYDEVGLEMTSDGLWSAVGAVCLCCKCGQFGGIGENSWDSMMPRRYERRGLLVADPVVG